MPKLWNATIATHRESVRQAVLDTTWALAGEQGLTAVTMSQIAERTGIGRATLYKYFPDVESILLAWHARQVEAQHARLAELRDREDEPAARLRAVLTGYARACRGRGGHPADLAALLHRGRHEQHGEGVDPARLRLLDLVGGVLADAASAGVVRADVPPAELASYCVGALSAAAHLPSEDALPRLVDLVLAGLAAPTGA